MVKQQAFSLSLSLYTEFATMEEPPETAMILVRALHNTHVPVVCTVPLLNSTKANVSSSSLQVLLAKDCPFC